MTLADGELLSAPAPHRWNVDDFFRASEAGIFDSQRVELIEGELIDMPSQKDPHAWAISRLVRSLLEMFPDPYWIKIQATLRFTDYSAPEPDIAVMSGPPSPPAIETPRPLLIVEVSETTLSYDRGAKASLYAANGIADYWVADVIAKQLYVMRKPSRDPAKRYGWGYTEIAILTVGDTLAPLAKPDTGVAVQSFLS
jgi:Uma2 family endonuclease